MYDETVFICIEYLKDSESWMFPLCNAYANSSQRLNFEVKNGNNNSQDKD